LACFKKVCVGTWRFGVATYARSVAAEVSPRIPDRARLDAVQATGLVDTEPEAAFDELTSLAASLLEAPFAFMTLVDTERSFWKSRFGLKDPSVVQNTVEESFCQYVIASGEPLIVGDVTANEITAGNPSIQSMGVAAWAGYPLIGPDKQVLGSFCVVDTVTRQWSESDIEVLGVLAASAGRELALRAAVQRAAQAIVARDENNVRLSLLAEIGRLLTESLDIEQTLAELAPLLVPLLGDWSIVSISDPSAADPDALHDVGWWHNSPEARPALDAFVAGRLDALGGTSATHDARRTLLPVLAEDHVLEEGLELLAAGPAHAALLELAPASYAVFPLVANGSVHGTVALMRGADREPMPPADIDLMTAVTHRAGMALGNARLYLEQQAISERLLAANARIRESARHDRTVARTLQDAMLTRLPEPDHLHLASRYLTADGTDQVGGDWFDALIPASGAVTLMIGDVSGHDIAAATVMGQLRNMLRAFAWEHPESMPSQLITRLDRAMWDLGIHHMTTLAVVRIEQGAEEELSGMRTIRWSSAGHPAPLLIDPAGNVQLLPGSANVPLGVRRNGDATRTDHSLPIEPGSALLLYTDGLVETRDIDYDTRLGQLIGVTNSAASLPLEQLLDTVLDQMNLDGTQADADDIALLAVRFHPQDQPRPAAAGPAHF
jgi:serine phosphatase RsbU (regulator of sigma subunit)